MSILADESLRIGYFLFLSRSNEQPLKFLDACLESRSRSRSRRRTRRSPRCRRSRRSIPSRTRRPGRRSEGGLRPFRIEFLQHLSGWEGALVKWLWETIHVWEVVGLNPGAIFWMDMTFFTLIYCKNCFVCLKRHCIFATSPNVA